MLCNESDVYPLELLIVNFSSEVIELGTCMWVIIEEGANELINFTQRMELYKIQFPIMSLPVTVNHTAAIEY